MSVTLLNKGRAKLPVRLRLLAVSNKEGTDIAGYRYSNCATCSGVVSGIQAPLFLDKDQA